MKPEYNIARFTAPARNNISGVTTCQRKGRVIQHGCVIRRGYCDGYYATKKDQQWKFPKKIAFKFASGRRWNVIRSLFVALCFLFGRGNWVESESLELELVSVKTFARHMLLGE